MKSLFILFCLYFTLTAYSATEEVEFYDPDIENLPPVAEMTGVALIEEEESQTNKKRGEEIQPLAQEEEVEQPYRRAYGEEYAESSYSRAQGEGRFLKVNHRNHRRRHRERRPHRRRLPWFYPPIIINSFPVGNICRRGQAYCHILGSSLIVESSCYCTDSFGFTVFYGRVSQW